MTRSVPLAAYDTLGVDPTDDFATIRSAWLRQVRDAHPDLRTDTQAATARLAALNDAWDALCWHRRLDADEAARWRRAEARRRAAARRARCLSDKAGETDVPAPVTVLPGAAREALAFRAARTVLDGAPRATLLHFA